MKAGCLLTTLAFLGQYRTDVLAQSFFVNTYRSRLSVISNIGNIFSKIIQGGSQVGIMFCDDPYMGVVDIRQLTLGWGGDDETYEAIDSDLNLRVVIEQLYPRDERAWYI